MRDKHIGFLIMNMEKGGGTERVTSLIANGIVKRGFKVSIISCQKGMKSCYELDDEIKLYSLQGEMQSNFSARKWLCFYRLKKLVSEKNIKVMIAVDVALYIYLLPLQCMGMCKCIAWEHFGYYVNQSLLVKIGRILAAKYANCVVVLGQKDLENYREHFSKIKRIEYIYNPLPIQIEKKSSMNSKRIIAAGRLSKEKGFDLLIEIWSHLESKYTEWTVDVYGDGPLKAELVSQVKSLELKNINFRGFSTDLKNEMKNASIFALTSRYEGFGLVLIEAQAVGLPCISFNCKDGPSEIIKDNVNGFLVEPENITMFVNKLELLMSNKELRNEFSLKSDIHLENYNIDRIVEKWISLIKEL